MKKRLFLGLILSIVFACIFLSANALAYEVTIDSVSALVQNEDSTTATIEIDITNGTETDKEFNPYIAVYTKNNRSFSAKTANKVISAGTSGCVFDEISVPKDKTEIYGKVFVWNAENFQPLTEAKTFSIDVSPKFEDTIITSGMTLESDVSYNNVILQSGTVNLNGHTMHVYGDLIQPGGTMTIGDGSLIVEGDYGIHADTEDETSKKICMVLLPET